MISLMPPNPQQVQAYRELDKDVKPRPTPRIQALHCSTQPERITSDEQIVVNTTVAISLENGVAHNFKELFR